MRFHASKFHFLVTKQVTFKNYFEFTIHMCTGNFRPPATSWYPPCKLLPSTSEWMRPTGCSAPSAIRLFAQPPTYEPPTLLPMWLLSPRKWTKTLRLWNLWHLQRQLMHYRLIWRQFVTRWDSLHDYHTFDKLAIVISIILGRQMSWRSA